MVRITKKNLPNETTIQVIFTELNEDNNLPQDKDISSIFKDLFSYPGQGRIYIGFPTQQTTGCCSHVAAQVIPTMERESIDLADKTLAKYNSEMLSLAGTLCRILYENEMSQLSQLYDEMIINANNVKEDDDDLISVNLDLQLVKVCLRLKDDENTKSICEKLEKRAAYALTYFTFNQSTPNSKIGEIIETQFFDCKQILPIFSTIGVLPISHVRIPVKEMLGFIKIVPIVPSIISEKCNTFLVKLKNTSTIKELAFQDVLFELENRILSEDEIVELLKWWISYRSKVDDDLSNYSKFMQLTCIGDRSHSLNKIRCFLNPCMIPPNVDIPPEVFPYTISKKLKVNDKDIDYRKWFGWSELSLVHWARYIVNKPDLETDPSFAEKVHCTLARRLSNMSKSDKGIISELFEGKKCVPTKLGMMIPRKAYFENVTIFSDLPTIKFEKPSNDINDLMETLGVRKHVELGILFDRLQNDEGSCDHIKLLECLVNIRNLRNDEIKILKSKPIWPKETSNLESEKKERFIAKKLYTPLPIHRELGLPIIDWKGRWNHTLQKEQFLIDLGLKEYITLEDILKFAAPPNDAEIREKALKYFIDNFEKKYQEDYNPSNINVEFLPCTVPNIYAKPSECFIDPECMAMKFKIIRQDLKFQVEKIGARQKPGRLELLNRLTNNIPEDENEAKQVFEYLAIRQGDFATSDWKVFSSLEFIPIRDNQSNSIYHTSPRNCFFDVQEGILRDHFPHIDFGGKVNKFLENCGVKKSPSAINYAELLIKSSPELWNSMGNNPDEYLKILRIIADSSTINFQLTQKMSRAPILAATKSELDSEKKKVKRYRLATAKEIFINDDVIYQKVFNPLVAPEENKLEAFYKTLGSRSLLESVKETSTAKGTPRETINSQKLRQLILERASLFYHECSSGNIKQNEGWLKKLKIQEIDYVETNYKLDNISKTEKNNTIILKWTLYITSESTLLDVSKHLAKNIYKLYKWKDIHNIHSLSITPLPGLEAMGYPVDRINRQLPKQHVVDNANVVKENKNESPMKNNSKSSLFSFLSSSSSSTLHPSRYDNGSSSRIPIITYEKTQVLRNSLSDAIEDFYSNPESGKNRSTFKSRLDDSWKEQTTTYVSPKTVDEMISEIPKDYCEIIPDELLHRVPLREIELCIPKVSKQSEILSYTDSLDRFTAILKDFTDIFRITLKNIRIFYDNQTDIIAFNDDKTLFFNFRFYLGLHDEECKIKPTINAMTYWFMMFCHEIAHNFEEFHNAEHEYYSLAIAETYMSRFLEVVKKHEISSDTNDR